ncbi:RHS repeat-associated core domain-containing protein [Cohnella sp. OV330]|uniref:SpvB/TcaC N-terminal domain-containing protein n=1 Tax=Cohnella sp. OV330 TaxID=1855288 RepID=UPI0008ED7E5D|nr:SpvB/TcaC N-terminal domain-containing protein [Cohnella sp. OV330]SFB62439.1 RHS repeat-associated core domain-containing protein [Cohnella sp. OV330]
MERMPINEPPRHSGAAEPAAGAPPLPQIGLPKGGGAIKGIGEDATVGAWSGTATMRIPLGVTPGRSGLTPGLTLQYDSGAGNGPFGLGWKLTVPSVSRKTENGLPTYRDEWRNAETSEPAGQADDFGQRASDTFQLAGGDDLVPYAGREKRLSGEYAVYRYRPRIEGDYAKIEHWVHRYSGESYWKTVSGANVTSLYGLSSAGRVADPADPRRVYQWLLEETADDKGNIVRYAYKAENDEQIDWQASNERNRSRSAGRYLKRIDYGNREPHIPDGWLFTVVLDYGEHDEEAPTPDEIRSWYCRRDPHSTYRPGFEVRTARLCRRMLMFHRFEELGEHPTLVRSDAFAYREAETHSVLVSVVRTGYLARQDGTAASRSMPPLEFGYSEAVPDFTVRTVDSSETKMPTGLFGDKARWTDLWGDGVSGLLTEEAGGWYFTRNLGGGRFEERQPVALKPSLAELGGGWQLADLAGDGGQYAVRYRFPVPGYHERRNGGEWGPFTPLEAVPTLDWNDPNLRFLDLTGDGKPDVLLTEQHAFTCYVSSGKLGFEPALSRPAWDDEERGPTIVFADGTESLFLADMNGDGLTDLVRVRRGEVAYWPNMGYGAFGPKIVMDGSPAFDGPDEFDPRRIRFCDVDGSGPADLLYLGNDAVSIWTNGSGNGWKDPVIAAGLPHPGDDGTAVDVVDLLGTGTVCLVWSSAMPEDAGSPLRYMDLTEGAKPHLLTRIDNNMGQETSIRYAASTSFSLKARAEGKPWATSLPFPVHVVERIDKTDQIGGHRLTSRYAYHHGYYDREEREFRGFGLVEQWDTDGFERLSEPGGPDHVQQLPPVRTRTWFHTGAFLEREALERQYAGEYYRDPDLPAERPAYLSRSVLPEGIDAAGQREAARALKGAVLRTETYADDGTARCDIPYTVTERRYEVKLLQPRSGGRPAVFRLVERESLDAAYERIATDPRLSHRLTLRTDAFGNVLRSAAAAYGRRRPDPQLPAKERAIQAATRVTLLQNTFTNEIDRDDAYRIPAAWESRSWELHGYPDPFVMIYRGNELEAAFDAAEVPFESEPDGSLQRRLIAASAVLYRCDDLSGPLPEGKLEALALPYETYRLSITPGMLDAWLPNEITDAVLENDGGYVRYGSGSGWWIRSGRLVFGPEAEKRFYQADGFMDLAGNASTVAYDRYLLMAAESRDSLGSATRAAIDYRVMQPYLVTDANGNRSSVAFDALGFVTATAVAGKIGEAVGDTLEGFDASPNPETVMALFEEPQESGPAFLRGATTAMAYDLDRYRRTRRSAEPQPIAVCTVTRDRHDSDAEGELAAIAMDLSYIDGFGRIIQSKKTAPPEEEGGPGRWLSSGLVIRNNKGLPFKQFEPFFSGTHRLEMLAQGVCTTVLYDPAGRAAVTLHANHSYEKVVVEAWKEERWDVHDTIHPAFRYDPRQASALPDPAFNPADDPDVGRYFRTLDQTEYLPTWYGVRMDPAKAQQHWPDRDPVTGAPIPGQVTVRAEEYWAAERAGKHAATPLVRHLDPLGHAFLSIADNGKDASGSDRRFASLTEYDIGGKPVRVYDPKGRAVSVVEADMTGRTLRETVMDAGTKTALPHADGKPLYAWNGRGFRFRHTHDALRRPLAVYARSDAGTEILAERTVYGESHPDSKLGEDGLPAAGALNLRGRVWMRFDGAGMVDQGFAADAGCDFKGNPLASAMRLSRDYKSDPDWSRIEPALAATERAEEPDDPLAALLDEMLEPDVFVTRTRYDALNRPIRLDSPDGSVTIPSYDSLGLLARLSVRPIGDGSLETVYVDSLVHNAKGQRERITYGNGVSSTIWYEKDTLRPSRVTTLRSSEALQNFRYVYDAVGNVNLIHDDAQQTIYFNNQPASPGCHYNYDALYRLTDAKAREHIGQADRPAYNWDDAPRSGLPHPGDGAAMRDYHEIYVYDEAGNMTQLIHQAGSGSWQRKFNYEESGNRLTGCTIGSLTETYGYDEHGSMTSMPHLGAMLWDARDKLRKVDLGGGGTAWYVYDSSGRRIRKVIERLNGTRQKERLYAGTVEVYREYGGDGQEVKLERCTLHISDDKERIASVDTRTKGEDGSPARTVRYAMSSRLQSCALELDEAGRIISYEEYSPYGSTTYQAVSRAEAPRKRYRYTGKERDEETGFYDHGARYYAPWLCRWTAADPIGIGDGPNVYAYAGCNPVAMSDPSGMAGETEDDPPVKAYDIPEVSGTDTSMYAEQGSISAAYDQAAASAGNPANSAGERIVSGVLILAAAPLALAEEAGRSIVNTPHYIYNAGKSLGEWSARAYMMRQAGDTDEAVVSALHAVTYGAEGFILIGTVLEPMKAEIGEVAAAAGNAVKSGVESAANAVVRTSKSVGSTVKAQVAQWGQQLKSALQRTPKPTFAPTYKTVPNGSLGPANGLTWPNLSLTKGPMRLQTPVFNPSVEVVQNPVNSTFQGVVDHELKHFSDMVKHPQFSYLATVDPTGWERIIPGRGIATYIMESRGYFAELGWRGLNPNIVKNSMDGRMGYLAYDAAFLAGLWLVTYGWNFF